MARFLIKWISNNQFGDQLKQNAVQFCQAVEMGVASWDDVILNKIYLVKYIDIYRGSKKNVYAKLYYSFLLND